MQGIKFCSENKLKRKVKQSFYVMSNRQSQGQGDRERLQISSKYIPMQGTCTNLLDQEQT